MIHELPGTSVLVLGIRLGVLSFMNNKYINSEHFCNFVSICQTRFNCITIDIWHSLLNFRHLSSIPCTCIVLRVTWLNLNEWPLIILFIVAINIVPVQGYIGLHRVSSLCRSSRQCLILVDHVDFCYLWKLSHFVSKRLLLLTWSLLIIIVLLIMIKWTHFKAILWGW